MSICNLEYKAKERRFRLRQEEVVLCQPQFYSTVKVKNRTVLYHSVRHSQIFIFGPDVQCASIH